jgi:hypothetical protein
MRTAEYPDGRLLVSHDRTRLALCFAVLGAVAMIVLLIGLTDGGWAQSPGGVVSALVACCALPLVLWERAEFVFDTATRTIRWRRRWAWWKRSGSLAFTDVMEVLVRSPIGDSGIPSRRVALKLNDGRELPMSAGYLTDSNDRILMLAGRIRELLGVGGSDSRASVKALAEAGETLGAVRLQRQTSDVSLRDALDDARRMKRSR